MRGRCFRVCGQTVSWRRTRRIAARPGRPHDAMRPAAAYATNDELADALDALARGPCRGRARAYSLGASALGRDVRALEIGDASTSGSERERWSGRARFGFIGNVHGDEPVGREIAREVARMVCEGGGRDARARRLTREATLFFVPTMNPDGFDARTRGNARGVDLNRDFPYARFAMPKTLRERGGGGRARRERRRRSSSCVGVSRGG